MADGGTATQWNEPVSTPARSCGTTSTGRETREALCNGRRCRCRASLLRCTTVTVGSQWSQLSARKSLPARRQAPVHLRRAIRPPTCRAYQATLLQISIHLPDKQTGRRPPAQSRPGDPFSTHLYKWTGTGVVCPMSSASPTPERTRSPVPIRRTPPPAPLFRTPAQRTHAGERPPSTGHTSRKSLPFLSPRPLETPREHPLPLFLATGTHR